MGNPPWKNLTSYTYVTCIQSPSFCFLCDFVDLNSSGASVAAESDVCLLQGAASFSHRREFQGRVGLEGDVRGGGGGTGRLRLLRKTPALLLRDSRRCRVICSGAQVSLSCYCVFFYCHLVCVVCLKLVQRTVCSSTCVLSWINTPCFYGFLVRIYLK